MITRPESRPAAGCFMPAHSRNGSIAPPSPRDGRFAFVSNIVDGTVSVIEVAS